jgi:hypothetical protein
MMNLEQKFNVTMPGDNITEYRKLLQQIIIDCVSSESITGYSTLTDQARNQVGEPNGGFIITTNNDNIILQEKSRNHANSQTTA